VVWGAAGGPTAPPGAGNPLPTALDGCDTEGVAVALDGGTLPGGPASSVVDLRRGVDVVREGAVPAADILAAVGRETA
jgi:tRNA A37 threonylcarbamoyladenosine synthetase subunit TsaC/SUA5/YrdC